jgi:hypothetical protein
MMRSEVFFDCVNSVRDGLFGHESAGAAAPSEPVETY